MLGFYLTFIDDDEGKNQFEELYIKYKQDMYSVAHSILHNVEDAEDAVHQAFLTIANNFEKVRKIPCQEIKAYIVIIIRNVSINIYNSNKRKAEHSAELNDNITMDVDVLEQYEYTQLVKVISELPQIYKDIVYLYYLEEFTAKEVAKMLNISVDTVWKRAERAKKLLKEALERGEQYDE
ncbi:MAG: sigma-70 family RNA polymerase sigma factor [Oscillospiraceae bacterium]|nr:sigma-70 family RNA polymerase sigma factor [Oscillospiraceae bacterium]